MTPPEPGSPVLVAAVVSTRRAGPSPLSMVPVQIPGAGEFLIPVTAVHVLPPGTDHAAATLEAAARLGGDPWQAAFVAGGGAGSSHAADGAWGTGGGVADASQPGGGGASRERPGPPGATGGPGPRRDPLQAAYDQTMALAAVLRQALAERDTTPGPRDTMTGAEVAKAASRYTPCHAHGDPGCAQCA